MPTFKVEVSHINLPLLLLLCCVLLQQRTHKELLWFHTVPPSLYPSPLCGGGEGVKREGREARHDDHHPSAPDHRRLHLSILMISGITEPHPSCLEKLLLKCRLKRDIHPTQKGQCVE